jgi:hypothetical protein
MDRAHSLTKPRANADLLILRDYELDAATGEMMRYRGAP